MRRTILLLSPLVALTAASAPTLHAGLWQVSSAPGTATLDGRALSDLPYTPPVGPETVCLTPDQARDPAAWLARDAAKDCTLTRRSVAGGRVAITGTCPPQAPGLPRGTVALTGRWTADSYRLSFATVNPAENGRMGFTGTLTGRRIGDCPD